MANDQYNQFEEQAKRLGSGTTSGGVSDEDERYFAGASDQIKYHVGQARRLLVELNQFDLLGRTLVTMRDLVMYNPVERRELIKSLEIAMELFPGRNPRERQIPIEFRQESPTRIPVNIGAR